MTSTATAPTSLPREDQEFLDQLITEQQDRPGMLLTILERIQERQPETYLPAPMLDYLAWRAGIPESRIYNVATFYALFNLKPQGRHTVCICRGTACHTRGSMRLLESIRLQLGLQEDDDEGGADKLTTTTADGEITVRTVACFGQCALAPVAEVAHHVLGHVNERALKRQIEQLRR